MTENDAEDIIELTEIVEEPDGEDGDPDEDAIRKAFEEDDFFSKIEEVDALSDASEGAAPEEESLDGDDESLDELLGGGDEDQDSGPDFDESLAEEPSEDIVDLEDLPVPEPEGFGMDDVGASDDLETSFELEESIEETPTEGLEAEVIEQGDVDDEFGELEDFKIDVSIPDSGPEDRAELDDSPPAEPSEAPSPSGDDAGVQSTGQMSAQGLMGTVGPEQVEAVLERVAREVLGETAERVFTEVAERVLKEEIERIKAEITRLSNRE